MNRALIYQNRAFRNLLPWLSVGILIAIFLSATSGEPGAALHPGDRELNFDDSGGAIVASWIHAALFLLYGGITVRSDRYYTTLPLSTRRLWLAHMAAVLGGELAILVVATIFTGLANLAKGVQPVFYPALIGYMVQLMVCAFLAVMAAQSFQLKRHEIPLSAGTAALLFLLWLAILFVLVYLRALPFAYTLLPLLAGLGLGLRIYTRLPPVFSLEPAPSAARAKKLQARPPRPRLLPVPAGHRQPRLLLLTTILRSVFSHWSVWLIGLWMIFVSTVASGYYYSGLNQLSLVIFLWVGMNGVMMASISRTQMLDPLPISRRLIFACMVLPVILIVFSSYTISFVIGKAAPGLPLIQYSQKRFDPVLDVRVPYDFWELDWSGELSPANPEHDNRPFGGWTTSVYKDSKVMLYNPYHTPEGSSPALAAAQLSQAVEDIYGEKIAPAELEGRYLVEKTDGSAGLKAESITLTEDYPDLKPRTWIHTLPLVILLALLPALLVMALTLKGYRLGAHRYSKVIPHFVLILLMTMLILGLLWSANAGYIADWKFTAFLSILIRQFSQTLPGSTALHWVGVVLLLGAGYWLAQSQFLRIHIPQDGAQKKKE